MTAVAGSYTRLVRSIAEAEVRADVGQHLCRVTELMKGHSE